MEIGIGSIVWILCGIFNAIMIIKHVKLEDMIEYLLALMGVILGPFVTVLILCSLWAKHSISAEARQELRENIREQYDELLKTESK